MSCECVCFLLVRSCPVTVPFHNRRRSLLWLFQFFNSLFNFLVQDWLDSLVSSVYCSSKHIIVTEQFEAFFEILDERFIAVGDYNAKYQYWGSRLANPKGRALHKTTIKRLDIISQSMLTYWPRYNRLWSHKKYSKNIFFN